MEFHGERGGGEHRGVGADDQADEQGQGVLTVPSARGIALAAGADLSRPVLVVDIGAPLTEVVLLGDGDVTDARRTALGTGDLDTARPPPGSSPTPWPGC